MAEPFASRFIRSIDANRTIKDELTAAVHSHSTRRRISVTDLVNPRQSFFRWTRPDIQPSPDRAQVMMAGTGFHALFGQAVATEEFVEQFVEFEGIVGKIDIYEDVPLELKTTSTLPDGPYAARPSYIDQLGMYCTMTGVPSGRLLVYRREQFGRAPELRAFQVYFAALEPIKAEMIRRRDLFQQALETKDPAGLFRCEWFERNCDYNDICGCDTAELMTRMIPADGYRAERDPDLEAALTGKLTATIPDRSRGSRLNDLVFPRKAAYERLKPDEEDEADETVEARLKELERQGFRGTLYEALRFGIPGAFKRLPVQIRTLSDRVGTFRGVPTLLRSTKFRQMVERDRLPYDMGHYFDRLAFECALADNDHGRLVLYYEVLPGEKFMVYDVGFKNLPAIRAEADRRLTLLETDADPQLLPACPPWMFRMCSFKDRCGCGEVA